MATCLSGTLILFIAEICVLFVLILVLMEYLWPFENLDENVKVAIVLILVLMEYLWPKMESKLLLIPMLS